MLPLTVAVYVCLFPLIFFYLSSLPVAHLNDALRRRLVVMGDSARVYGEITETPHRSLTCSVYSYRHIGPRFEVSSERQLEIAAFTNPQPRVECFTNRVIGREGEGRGGVW